jgi:hypothetical protein
MAHVLHIRVRKAVPFFSGLEVGAANICNTTPQSYHGIFASIDQDLRIMA